MDFAFIIRQAGRQAGRQDKSALFCYSNKLTKGVLCPRNFCGRNAPFCVFMQEDNMMTFASGSRHRQCYWQIQRS